MTRTYDHHSKPTPALGSISRTGASIPDVSGLTRLPVAPVRRAVLAGSAAVLMLAVRAAAAAASAPLASPDAGLIALCAGLDALQRRLAGLYDETWGVLTDAELGAADAAAYQVDLEQRRLLDRVCGLTPATPCGCAALARTVALLRPDLVRAGPHSDPDVRLVAVLVRGLAGRA